MSAADLDAIAAAAERAYDERQLAMLACWEDGWSAGEIGDAFGVSRNVPLGVIHRVFEADPEALSRKPEVRAA